MSGVKQYDRTELIDLAIELFRRQGFNGTSTAELVAELGVNRKSMYSEFGSKQGLFEAALERYSEEHLSRVLAPIEAPDAGADAIRDAFYGYAEASEGWASGRGCLMCNTAVERAALDPGSKRYVTAYLERLTSAFRHALGNAARSGDLEPGADLDELAAFLTMALIGVAACMRAEAPPEQLHAACRVATSMLGARSGATAR
ncbi:MAG: TetR/AcrR family transcriptional regulator [Ilumatobacter sp.]|uniref:TetR/AcrR family transcriptional regulator n=1 Tax=Ilumatobacter sp. TaxID=1967498 RepID=UPI0026267CB0|nr:TetR/AcrR family transcriptional regulator [Ilumatobacter sp.]MDJ0769407.1 TetR/AcrR family transcriptional regulator [Ilumatobacter sp.]